MAKQKETEPSALVPVKDYALARADAAEVRQIMADNFGGRPLRPSDLVRVKIPTGGGTRWEIETPEGRDEAKEITGVVVHWRTARALWFRKLDAGGGKGPPDCHSNDGKMGEGCPGGECVTADGSPKCIFNHWGSGTIVLDDAKIGELRSAEKRPAAIRGLADELDNTGGKKLCKEMRLVFVVGADDFLPRLIALPPTSIKPWSNYLRGLTGTGIAGADGRRSPTSVFRVLTTFTLERVTGKGVPDYSEVRLRAAAKLTPEEVVLLAEKVKIMQAAFTVNIADVESETVDPSDAGE